MATVNQLVRRPRSVKRAKSTVPALDASPQKRGGLHACIYDHTEKAELGDAESGSCTPDQWF